MQLIYFCFEEILAFITSAFFSFSITPQKMNFTKTSNDYQIVFSIKFNIICALMKEGRKSFTHK